MYYRVVYIRQCQNILALFCIVDSQLTCSLSSFLIKCLEKSLGAVVILSLVWNGGLFLTFSTLKQVILIQTKQNGYKTVPFGVYIHNLMFVFISDKVS